MYLDLNGCSTNILPVAHAHDSPIPIVSRAIFPSYPLLYHIFNLQYSQEKIDTESVNKKFIEEIKQERTEVLGENHSKDAKRSSLTLEQVVVQSHNCKDVVYSVG